MYGSIKRTILKGRGDALVESEDLIAEERKVKIAINGREVVSLYCTPLQVRELVVGLVMTEGIVEGEICFERMSILYGDEISVDVPAEGKVRTGGASITSGCVGGITFQKKPARAARKDGFSIGMAELKGLFGRFHKRSELYKKTGGVHSAALSDGEGMLFFAEDIGRHNAVDKVIGSCILEGMDFKGKVMLASGRLSSEIVSKCARWGIPMVASRAAPTALSLDIAEESGVTVVGFVRGDRLNVYTHPERVLAGGALS
jgi:FdhD protein